MTIEPKPSFRSVADYVKVSFENPQKTFKVFARKDDGFLRFNFALPKVNNANPIYGIIYEAGKDEGYLACEDSKTLLEMLRELSGIENHIAAEQIIELSPLYLLIALAACDVVLQDKYEQGWFTAAAVFNAYGSTANDDFKRLLFPLAYVAGDTIFASATYEDIRKAMDELVDAEVFNADEVDGTTLYTFSLELRYLVQLFGDITNSLALCRQDEFGNLSILCAISNQTKAWAFTIDKSIGRIERISAVRFNELCKAFLMTDSSYQNKTTSDPGKFCRNCGLPISPESNFCPNCGKQVL